MRYVFARYDDDDREWAYRFYISKSLQFAPQGKWITADLYDIIYPKPVDDRTGDEIAKDIISKAGLVLV